MSETTTDAEHQSPGDFRDYMDCEILLGMRAQSMGRDPNELVYKLRQLPVELVLAYFETEFLLRLGNDDCTVRIRDAVPVKLSSWLRQERANTWAVISAYNPYSQQLSAEENQRMHRLLEKLLDASDYRHYPAIGRSPAGDWEEPSFLVLNVSYDLAKAIGTVFKQNAVLFGETGAVVELVLCDR